jgi:hydrogenase expression/formation protein HypE
LRRVLDSIRAAVADCGVQIATGDTKVVERGRCEGLYINTAGLGSPLPGFRLGPDRIRPGDRVLTTGTLAEHGMAVLAAREGVGISNGPRSDTAPVHRLVAAIQPLAESVRFMRDPTRGGAAAVLNEAVERTDCGIRLIEESLPLSAGARAVGEMLGLDPLHAPSEGRLLAVCAPDAVDAILAAWRALPEGAGAAEIGAVTDERGLVVMETVTGGRRLVDLPRGELLPRIC